MKSGYLFISNGFKPTKEEANSLSPVAPGSFSKAAITSANELGWELHMGINRSFPEKIQSIGFQIKFYNSSTYRNVFAIKDILKAYKNLCQYLKANPQIKIIHCNTPIGGVVGRLAGRKFGKKVIYTAHGFHFYKGSPFVNRVLYKSIEKWLAHYTDILITINEEDYLVAQYFHLKKGGRVYLVPGVGIDISTQSPKKPRDSVLSSLGLNTNTKVCISIGNLDSNKNFETLIKAFSYFKDKSIVLLICGRGSRQRYLERLIKEKGLEENVKLLGFRRDIPQLLSSSDLFLLASKREGLPRSTMEAMVASLPCVVSDIRGNRDLIDEGQGGYLINPMDAKEFANAIFKVLNNPMEAKIMGEWNKRKVVKFGFDVVKNKLYDIFKQIF